MDHKRISVKIDRMALEGEGVARIVEKGDQNGSVAFVPYVLPLEEVEVELKYKKKSFSRWAPVKVIKGSPERVKPECPLFFKFDLKSPWCGGCDWQHINLNYQRELKRTLVEETISRLGGLSDVKVNPTLGSESGWRYRNKVQVPVTPDGNKLKMGFYSPGSHRVVAFDDCLIQPSLSVSILKYIKEFGEKNNWKAYDEDKDLGWLRHILIRLNQRGDVMLTLVATDYRIMQSSRFVSEITKEFPAIVGIHMNLQRGNTNVILGAQWKKVWGREKLTEKMGDLIVQFGPGSFFQVNTSAAMILYDKAIEALECDDQAIVLDLYCGVGVMTLMAAKKAKFALGVEVSKEAIRDADANAIRNNVKNVKFNTIKSEEFFESMNLEWMTSIKNNLKVIIDPPRGGCEKQVLDGLLKILPERIIYVSCNPATFARDVKILSSHYKLEETTPVDLFSQTSHVELVGKLIKL